METLFASAYRQLQPPEKAFVDGFVADIEREAQRSGERISNALHRPIGDDVILQSRGMLDRALVRAAIVERIQQLALNAELTPAKVIKEAAVLAFSSIGNYMSVDAKGQPVFDFSKAAPEHLAAIQSIDIEEKFERGGLVRNFKFKLHPKLPALQLLADYMGLQEADNPVWRAEMARPIENAALLADETTESAAERYARMIGA